MEVHISRHALLGLSNGTSASSNQNIVSCFGNTLVINSVLTIFLNFVILQRSLLMSLRHFWILIIFDFQLDWRLKNIKPYKVLGNSRIVHCNQNILKIISTILQYRLQGGKQSILSSLLLQTLAFSMTILLNVLSDDLFLGFSPSDC